MVDPLGSHAGAPSMAAPVLVMLVCPLPFAAEAMKMSRLAGVPWSFSNAMWVPSGDQAGRSSFDVGAFGVRSFGFVALSGCVRS